MSLFVSSMAAVQQPGVFPIEVAPPTVIEGISLGYIGYSFVGEWGPVKSLVTPTSQGDLINKFFPAGTSHTSTGYFGIMRRKAFTGKLVRVLGGSAGILPPLLITITHGGTPGSTSYSYRVVAKNGTGASIGSATFTTTTGAATLNSTDKNVLVWSSVDGATSYDVYRTASAGTPGTTGKIATSVTALTLDDTGLSASGSIPTTNTTGYAPASAVLLTSGSVPVARLVCSSAGVGPNTWLTAQVTSASNGDAAYFDLVVTLQSAATGSTTERFANLKLTATTSLPLLTFARLLDTTIGFEVIGTPAANPAAGTYAFVGGSDGASVTAADYQDALDLFALDDEVRVVVTDDVGDSIRAGVNADLLAHVGATTDRLCVLQGDQGNDLDAVIADSLNYVSDRVIYVGAWIKTLDDTGLVEQVSPFATMIATALVNLQPQQSHAWWNPIATFYYQGVSSIYSPQFSTADDGARGRCTQAGVCLPIRLEDGAYAALHDRTTSGVVNTRYAVTRRIKDFLAKSIKKALTPFVNGPNLADQWDDIKIAVDNFFGLQVKAGRLVAVDPVDINSQNNATTQALGQFVFVCTGRTPAPMEQIFPLINIGPGVVGVTFQ